jgi:tetratricopeptide (TPR) repeat protein
LIYQQILAEEPAHCDALTFLGTLNLQRGRLEHAVTMLTRSLEINSQQPAALNNLGLIFRPDEALAKYEAAIGLMPDYADAWNKTKSNGRSERIRTSDP